MKFLIDINPRQAEQIQKYLNRGSYENLFQFITTAIENQLALEKGDLSVLTNLETDIPILKEEFLFSKSSGFEKYRIDKIQNGTIIEPPRFENLVFSSQKIPEDQAWIWGQINKIFPVKLGLRFLQNNLKGRELIELNDFLENAATEASEFGERVRNYEQKNNKMRDEKTSAGLPSKDDSSKIRYKFQFIAYPRKDSLLDGAMAVMKFCNVIKKNNRLMIGITENGLKFSSLQNPMIDDGNFDISLNKEEAAFYLNHAKENLKGEFSAIKWLLSKIESGVTEREPLNVELKKNFGKIWEATDAVINTQRAGLTARMFELGLIEKEKDGIYVKYRVSEIGKKIS